jgi:tRNA-specific 2-thiouridylase
MARVLVAMSGGVDSSITAVLLHEQGHEVVGATLLMRDDGPPEMVGGARDVCSRIGVPHHVIPCQQPFRRMVVDYFIQAYAQGITPNPCLACNRDIKFRLLTEYAPLFHCDTIATGHYTRIVSLSCPEDRANAGLSSLPPPPAPQTGYALLRGADHAKDQSYVLSMLQQPDLARIRFPLGSLTKAAVREQARRWHLDTAERPESQDICFIPDHDYRRFLYTEAPWMFRPGPIIDQEGREVGEHHGLPRYTVGQRKGLGIAGPHPLFVSEIDPQRNALIVGPLKTTLRQEMVIERVSFVSGAWPAASFSCQVQVRAHAPPFDAIVTPLDGQRAAVAFAAPQRAITPGQGAVFYAGEMVLGGGCIVGGQTQP